MTIKLDLTNTLIRDDEWKYSTKQIEAAYKQLEEDRSQDGNYLGWVDLPKSYDKEEYQRVKEASKKIRSNSQALLVIGIGGSYLGALAAIEAIKGNFYNELDQNNPRIYFAGNNMAESYIQEIYDLVKDIDFSINVISKSGTTLESAIAYRIFKDLLIKKYGQDGLKDRIFVTTDKAKGALKESADQEGFESFVIPDDIGGRFSVFTPVGLLPMAVAGLDIDQLMAGAKAGFNKYYNEDFETNDAYLYAACRNILYKKGKDIEILASYYPELKNIGEWWKQLFGESEGKDAKGIFPASVSYSTDLHSLGQIIQDGQRNIFETVININTRQNDLSVPEDKDNYDGLNYISGKTIYEINQAALKGTMAAHVEGNVPNIVINIENMDEYHLGKIFYFFMIAVAISAYMLGVNPFDQPGVEFYKKNMYKLLKE